MTASANALTSRAISHSREAPLDTISARAVHGVLDALERLGYDADALADAAHLRRCDLTDPDAQVACTAYGAIVERAQKTRFTPNLGLHVAAQTPIGTYPLLDYLVLTSPDVDAGLRQLSRYFALVSSPLRIELAEDGASLSVRLVGSALPFVVEFTAALLVLHFRRETDGRFAAERLSFAHRPDDPREFARVLGCPVDSGASWNGAVVSEIARRTPLRRRDPLLRSVLERQADEIVARLPRQRSAAIDVRRVLESRMGQGGTGIHQVARHLATSARTLQRRLASEGSSFQELVEEWRKEAARRHLSDSTLAIAELAFLLGYSEPAAFHRAFKRWFGVTPQGYRRGRTARLGANV